MSPTSGTPLSPTPLHLSLSLSLSLYIYIYIYTHTHTLFDRFCGLVVRDPGCGGPGFDYHLLEDFLSSSGSGTRSTQPHEDN
jgi:hypothetical protein